MERSREATRGGSLRSPTFYLLTIYSFFCRSTVGTAQGINKVMQDFRSCTGLDFNAQKSMVIFFGGCTAQSRRIITNTLGMTEGELPIRYLGIPLISSRLSPHHCNPILEKMETKLEGWSTKSLSYEGRRELINSTLNSMHIYWSAILRYLLPPRTRSRSFVGDLCGVARRMSGREVPLFGIRFVAPRRKVVRA